MMDGKRARAFEGRGSGSTQETGSIDCGGLCVTRETEHPEPISWATARRVAGRMRLVQRRY